MRCIFLKKRYGEQDVDALIRELTIWWADVPEHLTKASPSESFARATLYLRLRYHYVLVLLTRSFLLDSTSESHLINRHVKICNDNNDRSITILIDMQSENLLTDSLWFDAHHILSTSLILLLRMLKNPCSSDLQGKAKSMQQLLKSRPGRIQNYANECFNKVLEDINIG